MREMRAWFNERSRVGRQSNIVLTVIIIASSLCPAGCSSKSITQQGEQKANAAELTPDSKEHVATAEELPAATVIRQAVANRSQSGKAQVTRLGEKENASGHAGNSPLAVERTVSDATTDSGMPGLDSAAEGESNPACKDLQAGESESSQEAAGGTQNRESLIGWVILIGLGAIMGYTIFKERVKEKYSFNIFDDTTIAACGIGLPLLFFAGVATFEAEKFNVIYAVLSLGALIVLIGILWRTIEETSVLTGMLAFPLQLLLSPIILIIKILIPIFIFAVAIDVLDAIRAGKNPWRRLR